MSAPASSRRRRRPARGGRGGSESRAVIAAREHRVWELSLRGCTQRDIAQAEALSQAAVSKILTRVRVQVAPQRAADASAWAVHPTRHSR